MKKAKKMFSIILAFTIVLSLPMYCLANSGLSAATSLSSGSYYYIKNKNSGLYLDAENDGSFNVVQYNYHGALNQTWKLVQVSTNVYRLESQSPYYQYQGRKCLSVSEYTDNVDLYYMNSTLTTQRWNITLNSSDGTFTISSLWDNKVLQVENSSSSTADVIKATSTGANSQKWYFEKIPTPNNAKISLENSLPDSKFWNHSPTANNSVTSIRNSECTHHEKGCKNANGVYDGTCGCNSYSNSIQCNGFAKYMAKLTYGTDIWNNTWRYSEDESSLYFVKPGDYIRYNGHSVFVVDIKPDIYTVLVAECNYGPDCIIKWYREISIYDIMDTFTHIYKSPYVFVS